MPESRNISITQVISEFSFLMILLKFSIRKLRNEKKVELFLISHFIFIFYNFKKSDFEMAGMSTDTIWARIWCVRIWYERGYEANMSTDTILVHPGPGSNNHFSIGPVKQNRIVWIKMAILKQKYFFMEQRVKID